MRRCFSVMKMNGRGRDDSGGSSEHVGMRSKKTKHHWTRNNVREEDSKCVKALLEMMKSFVDLMVRVMVMSG